MRFTIPGLITLVLASSCVQAMQIEWVRMTGQYPVETSPLVVDLKGDGKRQIVALGRGGQVMLWSLDGKAIGAGPDGASAQLPAGRWTTTATLVGRTLVACSVEGTVVALDTALKERWRFSLPGATTWGRGRPAVIEVNGSPAMCFGDNSGAFTCLNAEGKQLWQVKPGLGSCQTVPRIAQIGKETVLLATAGNTLFCLGVDGSLRWKRDLGGAILSQPEVLKLTERRLILCGAGSGALVAMNEAGEVQWQTELGDEIDSSISVLRRSKEAPLIVCTGLWGNVHALDADGHVVWTHLYRAKGRATPLITDINGDGRLEVVVPTYDQRIYAFGEDGGIVDTVRLNGGINASPVLLEDPATPGRADFLVTTGSLLAYRLRPGLPVGTHGIGGSFAGIGLEPRAAHEGLGEPVLIVRNPNGALLAANVWASGLDGRVWVRGCETSRSAFEIALPLAPAKTPVRYRAVVRGANGGVQDIAWDARPVPTTQTIAVAGLRAWATPAFGLFADRRLTPDPGEFEEGRERDVQVRGLYRNEASEGAFVVASTLAVPVHARVTVDQPLRSDGRVFGGKLTLRRVAMAPAINGEDVADALPMLGDAGILTIEPGRAAKIWFAIDASGAEAGEYRCGVRVTPVNGAEPPRDLTLTIEVLPLDLPKERPLRLCTWDYVPNKLIPSWTADALDDMGRHGVDVFPRANCVPPVKAGSDGRLSIDWAGLDQELNRLKGRGQFLLQLGSPDVKFASEPVKDIRHAADVAYVRAIRDHLRERGLGYGDWALYPVDEPGLGYGGSVNELVKAATLFREADPRIRIYTDPVPSLSSTDFERIAKLIDVWCPNMRLVNGLMARDPRIEWIMKSGKPVWSYECVGQVKSLSPLRYNRANAWRGLRFGLNGIGFWTHSMTQVDPWQRNEKSGDEYALVYAGDRPVPSVRWEAVRDGMQDAAAVALLRSRTEKHRRAGTKRDLVAQADEAIRIAIADIAQLSDDTFIESRDYLRSGDRVLWHTWTDVALFATHRARIAELTAALGE